MIRIQNFIFILWKFLQMSKLLCNVLKYSGGGKCPHLVARLLCRVCFQFPNFHSNSRCLLSDGFESSVAGFGLALTCGHSSVCCFKKTFNTTRKLFAPWLWSSENACKEVLALSADLELTQISFLVFVFKICLLCKCFDFQEIVFDSACCLFSCFFITFVWFHEFSRLFV